MRIMVVPNLRFSVGIALAGLAQFLEEEICKPQVGGSIPLARSTFQLSYYARPPVSPDTAAAPTRLAK